MIQSDFPTRQPAPKIDENGTWLEWDELTQAYVDTGVPARANTILSEQDTDGFYVNRIVGGGGGSVTVDTELSAASENPVQNKVVKAAVDEKISSPSNPTAGQFLVYNGTAWVAQTLSEWQGGSY